MAAEGNDSSGVNAGPVVEFEREEAVAGPDSGGHVKGPEDCNGVVHVDAKMDEKDDGDGYVLVDCRESDDAMEGDLPAVVDGVVDPKGVESGVDGEGGLRQNSDLIGEGEVGVAQVGVAEDLNQKNESYKENGVDRGESATPDSSADIVVEKEGEAEASNGVGELSVVEVVAQADGNEHRQTRENGESGAESNHGLDEQNSSDSSFEVVHEDGKEETTSISATNTESVSEHAVVVEETVELPPENGKEETSSISATNTESVSEHAVEVEETVGLPPEHGKEETSSISATNTESVSEHVVEVEETVGLPPEPLGDVVSFIDEGLGEENRSIEETVELSPEPLGDEVLCTDESHGEENRSIEETVELPPEPLGDAVSCIDEGHGKEDRSIKVAGDATTEEQTNAEVVAEAPSRAGELELGDLSEEVLRSESSHLEDNDSGEPSAQGPSGEAGMETKYEENDVNAICLESFSVYSIDDVESKSEIPCLVDASESQVEVTNESVDGSQDTVSRPLEDVISEVEVIHLPTEEETTAHACLENEKVPESEANEGTVDVYGAETSEDAAPSTADGMDLQIGAELTSIGDDAHASNCHVMAGELEAGKAESLAEEGKSTSTSGEVEVNSDQCEVMSSSLNTGAKQESQVKCEVEATLDENAVTSDNNSKQECKDNDATVETCKSSLVTVVTHHVPSREVTFGTEDVICSVNQDKSLDKEDSDKSISKEDNIKAVIVENGVSQSTTEDPSALITDLRFYMIRFPRTHDDALTAKSELAQRQLEERTQSRDAIRMAIRSKKVICDECWKNFDDAKKEERAARKAIAVKNQELNAFYEMTNKIQLANSIDDIDDRMHCLKHRMQHETISLKEEKQLMREIKELKQEREKHSSRLAPEAEMQKAFEQKDQIDKELKRLTPEMVHLQKELSKAEMNSKAARKKYDDECQIMKDLQAQHKAADDLRQEAYLHLRNLKKELYEKNKHFYKYKDDVRAAVTYASSGDKEALRQHCYNQVEGFMELWNRNDEFRSQYVKSNQNSIIRRFRTLDGRSLGPDEEPAILPNTSSKKVDSSVIPLSKSDTAQSTEAKDDKAVQPSTPEKDERSSLKVGNRSNSDKPNKPSWSNRETAPVAVSSEETEVEKEERLRKKTEEDELKRIADELARKEAEKRKEIAAAALKEKVRLEQIAKAKEAEERKRRKAEKAKAIAEIRAQKEAEMREKRRLKKEKQKESKVAGTQDVASGGNRTANEANGAEQFPSSLPEAEEVPVPETKVSTGSKKPSRAPQVLKQQNNKAKPLPPSLRNRGKRRMQTWMWVLLPAIVVLILFLVGNYVSISKISSQQHSEF